MLFTSTFPFYCLIFQKFKLSQLWNTISQTYIMAIIINLYLMAEKLPHKIPYSTILGLQSLLFFFFFLSLSKFHSIKPRKDHLHHLHLIKERCEVWIIEVEWSEVVFMLLLSFLQFAYYWKECLFFQRKIESANAKSRFTKKNFLCVLFKD